MKKNRLLENLNQSVGSNIPMKRYSLADMISESYKMIYQCNEGTNLKKLAESHLDDVRQNPKDIERLSRQLSILKEVSRMVESNDLKDEDLVDEKNYDTVEPKEDRVIIQNECNECDDPQMKKESCNESNTGAIGAKVGDTIIDTKTGKEGVVKKVGQSGNYSLIYVDFGNGLRKINPMDDAQTTGRYTLKKESIKEADDPDLTDEELEELAKHLETIRKERKNAPKTEMKEEVTPRRGIKCHLTDSNDPKKKDINEATESYVSQYGIDILAEDGQPDTCEKIEYALTKAGLKVVGCQPTGVSWSIKEYEDLLGMDIGEILGESKEEKLNDCDESKSYKGLENFKKQSESKAFYKTFKKMNDSLKEGKALTRQESIDLYKASNSALTQLSIELEHNPEFLDTFKESVSLLSKDVSSLLESLTRGKAPSKATMKSLAKFSEALLNESESAMSVNDYIDAIKRNKGNSKECDSLYARAKRELGKDIKYVTDVYARYRNFNESEEFPEYASDFKVVDSIPAGNNYTVQICYIEDTYSDNHYGVQVVDKEGNPVEGDEEIDALTYDKFFKNEEDVPISLVSKLVNILKEKAPINESDEDDETDSEVRISEKGEFDDFIGDDGGDVQSEEADEFDQEYADARVELHKDLEDKHADDEDPEVQEKLAQDAEEVINLPGTTEEQIAQINGEESTEESENDDTEDESDEGEVDDEITDDELEELKKHLTEMRTAKKSESEK